MVTVQGQDLGVWSHLSFLVTSGPDRRQAHQRGLEFWILVYLFDFGTRVVPMAVRPI